MEYTVGIESFIWSDLCVWLLSLDFCTENRKRLVRERNEECCFPGTLEITIKTPRCGTQGLSCRLGVRMVKAGVSCTATVW